METFDYHGIPIRYERQGAGEPVIFIHNGGTSHAIWREVAPRVAERYQTFAVDLLGFGDSGKPAAGYTLDNYVNLLAEFIDAHKLAPVRLVGNCMGSAMSLAFATRRPQDVRALVLVNPLTDATYSAGTIGSTLWLRKKAPGVARAVYAPVKRMHLPKWMAVQSLAFQFGPIGRQAKLHHDETLCACFTNEGQMHSLLGVLDDLMTYSVFDRFERGADFPPICTVWGESNRVLSAKAGRTLNEKLRPERAEWLKGCGHLVMLEKPDEVSRIILEFFAAQGKAKV